MDPLEPVWSTLGMHPSYLEAFAAAHNFIMRDIGPVRMLERSYLAMMVRPRFPPRKTCFEIQSTSAVKAACLRRRRGGT